MSEPSLHDSALRFFLSHQGEHLSHDRVRLLGRCVGHLSDTFGVSQRAAEDAALLALAEFEGRGQHAYIDVDRCTSFAVFVTDPDSGLRWMLTARDLAAFARQQRAPWSPAAPPVARAG
ncbi:MAG: hypothetical protein KatS3mg128_0069 [Silanimonas sp.]|nr:MAG: hypothetical protein KatS3mg128_0069 [Silanimonas sp.]